MRHMSSFMSTLHCSYLELPCHCACKVTADRDLYEFKLIILLRHTDVTLHMHACKEPDARMLLVSFAEP